MTVGKSGSRSENSTFWLEIAKLKHYSYEKSLFYFANSPQSFFFRGKTFSIVLFDWNFCFLFCCFSVQQETSFKIIHLNSFLVLANMPKILGTKITKLPAQKALIFPTVVYRVSTQMPPPKRHISAVGLSVNFPYTPVILFALFHWHSSSAQSGLSVFPQLVKAS